MVRRIFTKEEYAEIAPAYERQGTQYYFLRVNPQEQEDGTIIAIEDVFDHEPNAEDKAALYNGWLAMEKRVKLAAITAYDISDAVNVFEIAGQRAWLDKATRVGLQNSLHVEQEAGHATTLLYLDSVSLSLSIAEALEMLAQLELYAIDCYRQTEAHKAAVNASDNIEYVNGYDYTTGYPEHPVFNAD